MRRRTKPDSSPPETLRWLWGVWTVRIAYGPVRGSIRLIRSIRMIRVNLHLWDQPERQLTFLNPP